MDVIILIGRLLFAYLFIGSAVGHLTQTAAMAGYAQAKGLPQPKLAVQLSGLAFGLGALSILLGIWGDLGALVVALTVFVTAFAMHAFWKETDAQAKQMDMIQFNKDLALAGGALAFFALYHWDAIDWAVTGPLFT
jgi:putative oxidoreductase